MSDSDTQEQGSGAEGSEGQGSEGNQSGNEGEGTQGGTGAEGKQGKQGGQDGGESNLPSEEEFKNYDPDRALSTLRAQRAEEKKLRDQAATAETELQQTREKLQRYEDQNKTEEEKRQQALTEKDTRIQELEKQVGTLESKTKRSGFLDAAQGKLSPTLARLAYRLSDDVGVELKYDADYKLTNFDAYLAATRKAFPDEFGIPGVNGGERQERTGGPQDMNTMIRQQVGR
jgi:hypothetical protein